MDAMPKIPSADDVKLLSHPLEAAIARQEAKWKVMNDAIEEVYPHVKFWRNLADHPTQHVRTLEKPGEAFAILLSCIAKHRFECKPVAELVEKIFNVNQEEI